MLYSLTSCFKKGKKKKPEIGLITGFFGGELGIRTLGSLWEHGISSAAPSTSRTTLQLYISILFSPPKNHSKNFWGENQERKQKTIRFFILKTLIYEGFPADETTKQP